MRARVGLPVVRLPTGHHLALGPLGPPTTRLADAKHPAQVEVYHEDVAVGYWTTVKFSGALAAKRVNDILDRVSKLQTAVKFAREEANNTDVVDQPVGAAVFGYLFG
jgi:hypothetical protein